MKKIGRNTQKPIKKIFVNVRFTEDEYELLRMKMANVGYLSRSRFIRDSSIGELKTKTFRSVLLTDDGMRRQINQVTMEIRRIGNNYNNIIRVLSSVKQMKRKDGSPVISPTRLMRSVKDLEKCMESIYDEQEKLIRITESLSRKKITQDNK